MKDQGLVLIGAGLPRTGRDGHGFSQQTKYFNTKDLFKQTVKKKAVFSLNKRFYSTNNSIQ